jgi:D-tyrosyl-tRNA(Tyr) deacylase
MSAIRAMPDKRACFDSWMSCETRRAERSRHPLLADTRKGNRPSFGEAAPPEQAERLYERFCEALQELGVPVQTGVFGARMEVELVNDGR